jgi:hypothetical protein
MRSVTLTLIALLVSMLFASVGQAAPSKKKAAALRRLQDRGVTYVSFSSVANHVSGSSIDLVVSHGATVNIGVTNVGLNKTGSGGTIGSLTLGGNAYNTSVSVVGLVSGGLQLFNPITAGGTIDSGVVATIPTGTGIGAIRPLGSNGTLTIVGGGTLTLTPATNISGILPVTLGGAGGN